jgi:transcriptional regulator with XRE-family HTH domain
VCYENEGTVPAIETLEKMARALEVPLYQLFYEGDAAPAFIRHRQGELARQAQIGALLRKLVELVRRL